LTDNTWQYDNKIKNCDASHQFAFDCTVGQEVARLADNKNMTAGEHTISWTAEDLPNGVYFYRLVAGNFDQIRKMILIK
jgi:hypothetical protein